MGKNFEIIENSWGEHSRYILQMADINAINYAKSAEALGVTEADVIAYIDYLRKNEKEYLDKLEKIAKENIPVLKEKGRQLIAPVKLEHWDDFVERNATSEYRGTLSAEVMQILEDINNGRPLNEIVSDFNSNNHYNIAENIIRYFVLRYANGDTGLPFFKATHFGEWTQTDDEIVYKILHDYDNCQETGERVRK